MVYRPLVPADLDACADDVFYPAEDELHGRFNLPITPRNKLPLTALFEHIRSASPDRAWVAEMAGQVVGFGIAAQRGEMTFLGFLFVRPEVQARRIGRELLERTMANSDYRAVCIFSIQPVSTAMYARLGMLPRIPIYMLAGRPTGELACLPAGFDVRPIGADLVDELDREVTGLSRPDDHAAWQSWGRRRFGLFDARTLVGYGYAQPAGRLGPVIVRDAELLLPFVGRLMREVPVAGDWLISVPGPAAALFSGLLEAGMRIDGPPAIYCASELRIDHSRYIPGSFALP